MRAKKIPCSLNAYRYFSFRFCDTLTACNRPKRDRFPLSLRKRREIFEQIIRWIPLHRIFFFNPSQWRTAGSEIYIPSAEDPELSRFLRELWRSDAIRCHILEPSLDFNEILTNQKNSTTLPLSTKRIIMPERETGLFQTKPSTWRQGTDTSWRHVTIVVSLKTSPPFPFFFFWYV